MSALKEAYTNNNIRTLILSSAYASSFTLSALAKAIKSDEDFMNTIMADADTVDRIRNDETARATFNKNRIRLLTPGDVSWTVPDDWPTDFVHVQLVGGGGAGTNSATNSCGEYKQFTLAVTPGQVLTGNIGSPGNNSKAGDVTFAGVTAKAGAGAVQSGAFLVKASDGTYSGAANIYGIGGFEGGPGGSGVYSGTTKTGGVGDGTLGVCEGTGGVSFGGGVNGENGGGGGVGVNGQIHGAGGGYGGGGLRNSVSGSKIGSGGSGAIIITCPDGYIPDFVVYNTIDGVTEWRRDENIFNDFGETA